MDSGDFQGHIFRIHNFIRKFLIEEEFGRAN